jgi:hypothetical protein
MRCKHGEFDPMKGCPQCIEELHKAEAAEREAEDLAAVSTNIVKIKYWNDTKGEPAGRDYSFYSEDPLDVGDFVQVPTEHGTAKALITAVNVPEDEILAFKDRVKTIPSGSIRPPVNSNLNVAEGGYEEVNLDRELSDISMGYIIEAQNQLINNHLKYEKSAGIWPLEEDKVTFENLEAVTTEMPFSLATIQNEVGRPDPQLFQLYQEAAGLLRVAKDRIITTNADLKPATDDLVVIATCKKAMFARKTELIGPLKAKLDLVNNCFNDLMSPVTEADRITRGKVSEYDRIIKQRAAEAARIEAEKLKLAQEEAALSGTGEITVPLETTPTPTPIPERTRTDLGTLGGRDNWKARVIDMKLLPDEFKIPDMQTLNAKAKSSKGTVIIPGVEFFNDRIVTVYTKGEK